MTEITIVSKYNYLAEALSCVPELAGRKIFTVSSFKTLPAGIIILDECPKVSAPNAIHLGNHKGADCPKPLRLNDLLKLINTRMQKKVILLDHVEFNSIKKTLKSKQAEVLLTNKEAELLNFLLSNQKQSFTAKELLENIWGYKDDIKTNTLDTHLYSLRKNLDKVGIKDLIKQKESRYSISIINER